MYNRPKKGETERDLLSLQKSYMEEKSRRTDFVPTVNVKDLKPKSAESPPDEENEVEDIDDQVYFPSALPNIMGDIVEKNVDVTAATSARVSGPRRPASVFSKRALGSKSTRSTSDDGEISSKTSKTDDRSYVLEGDDASEIHNRNKATVESMSREEIMEERDKLMSTMDPKLLEYVQSLRKAKGEKMSKDVKRVEVESRVEEMECTSDTDNEVMTHPNFDSWLHFDVLEKEKLSWMENFREKNRPPEGEPYEARFDFKGRLLPYAMEYNEVTRTLYHHSEDGHRPGYSMSELFQLARSSVVQQRAVAVRAVAGLLDFFGLGLYDGVIEIPLTKIFFILRYSLDENVAVVYERAARGLRNMLYHNIDEVCLDNALPFERGLSQPQMKPRINKKDDGVDETKEDELKDFHLTELDLIEGCVRTDILARISYMIRTMNLSLSCVDHCLEILIRIARHSHKTAEAICRTDGIPDKIFSDYLPSTFAHQSDTDRTILNKITITSLKLLRVISSQSKTLAETFVSKYNVIERVLSYIGYSNANSAYLIKIQIESCHLFSVYLLYGIGSDTLNSVLPILWKTLNYYVESINLNERYQSVLCNHAMSILSLLRCFIKYCNVKHFDITYLSDTVLLGISKWSSQIVSTDNPSLAHLSLTSVLYDCACALIDVNAYDEQKIDQMCASIIRMMNSSRFETLSARLTTNSNLLSPSDSNHSNSESNLSRLNTVLSSDLFKLIPSLQESSPIDFVCSIAKFGVTTKKLNICDSLINCANLSKYVDTVGRLETFKFHNNWFTRGEFDLLISIIRMSTLVSLSDDYADALYNLSYKLSYTLPSAYRVDLQFLIEHVLFNKKYLTLPRSMAVLNVNDSFSALSVLDEALELYKSVLSLNYNADTSLESVTLSDWDLTALPRDWLYSPIVDLYSQSLDVIKDARPQDDRKVSNTVVCLKWITMTHMCFPSVTKDLSLTNQFCRLICIFLVDNSMFLNPTVKLHLRECLRNMFSDGNIDRLNFDAPLDGVGNFQDLYVQLVNQFQAVSYGDALFSSCVLIPLAQRHNVKWRKLVWSEYAGCLRFLDCPEEQLFYPLDEYLSPGEKDYSLLKCYHRALNGNLLRSGTITYKIASHHIATMKSTQ